MNFMKAVILKECTTLAVFHLGLSAFISDRCEVSKLWFVHKHVIRAGKSSNVGCQHYTHST